MNASPYTQAELERTLADLRRRFPSATADDAHTIIMDSIWAEEDEQAFFARDDARRQAELDEMAVSA